MTNLENGLQCTAEFVLKALKKIFFVLIVIITPENIACIHIKKQMLGVNENSARIFHTGWNELLTFQGQLKLLYKQRQIKTVYFSIFRSGFRKIL